jgi:ABC-type Co2+ transport system permease subunit
MAEVQWYYARDDQQFGPVSAIELKQLADDGRLAPDDLLWREGMDTWATAINLRGLFAEAPATPNAKIAAPTAMITPAVRPHHDANVPSAAPASLRFILRATQIMLWSMCVLVVLSGIVLFTRAFLIAKGPAEEAAAAAVFATFFLGAYVLARCGEKLSRLLLAVSKRRSR